MSHSNCEQIFCDILPEISRRYENELFTDSLNIFMKSLRIGESKEKYKNGIECEIDGVKCNVQFDKCQAIRQKRINENEEMMFGVFGQDTSTTAPSSDIADILNARLILPKPSDNYTSHIQLRDYDINDNVIISTISELFSCSIDNIKIRQRNSREIYLHLDFEREEQTHRSVILEAIYVLLNDMDKKNDMIRDISNISTIILPFVHFGKVRICANIDENDMRNVKIFNLFGSLIGVITGIGCYQNDKDIYKDVFISETQIRKQYDKEVIMEDTVMNILKDEMKLLKNGEMIEDIMDIPMAYLGIDSIRIVQLEYYIGRKYEWIIEENRGMKPYLMTFKTLRQVIEYIRNGEQKYSEMEKMEKEDGEDGGIIEEVANSGRYSNIPLSSQQKRILFMNELESTKEISQFNEPFEIKFIGSDIDIQQLTNIINYLIIHNSVLRTIFKEEYQYLQSATECYVPIRMKEEGIKKEKMENIQCILIDNNTLIIIFNHICIDGQSLKIFYEQFQLLYYNMDSIIPKYPQYHQYSTRQNMKKTDEKMIEYWKEYLKKASFEELPTDYNQNINDNIGESIYIDMPTTIENQLNQLIKQHGVTRFELLFYCFKSMIHDYFGMEMINIGYAVDRREYEYYNTIGCFTNIILLISERGKGLDELQKEIREGRKNGGVDYEDVIKLTETRKDGQFELFVVNDIIDNEQKMKKTVRFSDKRIDINRYDMKKMSKYQQTWYFRQNTNGTIGIEVEYMIGLYKKKTIEYLIYQVFTFINNQLRYRSIRRNCMIRSDYPRDTVSQIIDKTIGRIQYERKKYMRKDTYTRDINRYIQGYYGQYMNEYPIIIQMKRNQILIDCILSIWMCGLYPIPININTTEAGLEKVMEQLGRNTVMIRISDDDKVIINGKKQLMGNKQVRMFNLSTVYDMAYVTCTSGSTGTPKLVGTAFEGHSNLAVQYTKTYQISDKDTVCQVVDPSFDIFFADITKCLCNNATLLLCRDSICSIDELNESTNAYLMPAFISRILSTNHSLSSLTHLQYGGEQLQFDTIEKIMEKYPNIQIWQEYGLTEQTVYSSKIRIKTTNDVRRIGDPYDNIDMVISDKEGMDMNGRMCMNGQLILKGCGLMRGYYGREDGLRNGNKELWTGDQVSIDISDKKMIFMGRKDSQIKINGHRIDLFEIETIALSSKLIDSCVCVVSDKQYIVLFIKLISKDQKAQLMKYMENELIYYKVPKEYIEMEQFPLTRTGKIDKNELRRMADGIGKKKELKEREMEEMDTVIMEKVKKWLEYYSKINIISVDCDIISCGIDSISIMLTIQKMRNDGVEMKAIEFFKQKTIRKICGTIETGEKKEVVEKKMEECREQKLRMIKLNHIQQRILFLSRYTENDKIFNMNTSITIGMVDQNRLTNAVNTVVQGNQLLRSDMIRRDGDNQLIVLSATESFYYLMEKEERNKKSMIEIWKDGNDIGLRIHHLICDGRGFEILEKQISDMINGYIPVFENNHNIPQKDIIIAECPDMSIGSDMIVDNKSILYPSFKPGSPITRQYFKCPPNSSNHSTLFTYCHSINTIFNINNPFPIAVTFANRNPSNWNTVSMFANTLPIHFNPSTDNIDSLSQRITTFNQYHSNIPLYQFTQNTGQFADFAINFHKKLDRKASGKEEEYAQFPILFTYSETENEGIIDYDKDVIKERIIESLISMLSVKNDIKSIVRRVVGKVLDKELSDDDDVFMNGCHSLTAMKIIDMIGDELTMDIPIKMIFDNRTIQSLSQSIDMLITNGSDMETSDNRMDTYSFEYPLSPQQLQMYYLSQMTDNSTEYQLPFIQPFPLSIDAQSIHRALLMTIQQQNIYRTIISIDDITGEPYQQVISMTECYIRCQIEQVANEEELHEEIRRLCGEVININDGYPLIRAIFIRSDRKCVAFLHLHHLISDAKSTQITNNMMKEWIGNEDKQLIRQQYTYRSYCEENRSDKEIRMEYLDTVVKGIQMIRKGGDKKEGWKEYIDIPADIIRKNIQTSGNTPFIVFINIISDILYQQYYHSKSFNIAFPIMNRNEKTSNICGYFLNNLLINYPISYPITYIIQSNYPYSDVINAVRKKVGRNCEIADVYINCRYDLEYDETDDEQLLELIPLKIHFPIEFDIDEIKDIYRITMRTNRVDKEGMGRILEGIRRKLEGKEMGQGRNGRRMDGWRKDYPKSIPLPQLQYSFFSTTAKFGIFEDLSSMKYTEVWNKMNKIRHSLMRNLQIKRGMSVRNDDIIGVIGNKSIDTIISCLSVQLSGASYLPIDESYPNERIKEILKDTVGYISEKEYDGNRPIFDITSKGYRRRSKLLSLSSPYDIAYCISTSGTTGKPKTVCISSKSVSNLCLSSALSMHCHSNSHIYQFTNFVYDNSVLEVYMSMCCQSTLIFPSSQLFDISVFSDMIISPGISHCLLFPSLVQSFNINKLDGLAYWIVGGEKLCQSLLDKALSLDCHIIQNYGPTETTAFAITKRMRKGDISNVIGRGTYNTQLIINDNNELLIRGEGVMRGYINKYEKSFEIIDGREYYGSGDICKMNGNEVEYIGRSDTQIKIRGYRVEVSEIESIIENIDGITMCKVLFDQHNQQLYAFYTANSDNYNNKIQEECQNKLEKHKIPSFFKWIHQFPLTNNSKIDTEKLRKQMKTADNNDKDTSTQSTESVLLLIWISILNCPPPQSTTHFFFIGGHSLLLIRLSHQIQTQFHINLSVSEILSHLIFSDMITLINTKCRQNIIVLFPGLYGGCTAYLKLMENIEKDENNVMIVLDEENGNTVEDIGRKYKRQIDRKYKYSNKFVFIGASSAGTFAYSTSVLYPTDVTIQLLLIDAGTYWDLIDNIDYQSHTKDIRHNLSLYGADESSIEEMIESSWSTLQVLKSYKPPINRASTLISVLSVDGTDLGWSKLSSSTKVFKIEGDHYEMLRHPQNITFISGLISKH